MKIRTNSEYPHMRAFACLAPLLAGTAFCTAPAAFAQASIVIPVPADDFLISRGGVDMRTGRFVYAETDLAAGTAGSDGGLALVRTLTANDPTGLKPLGNFSHNWDIKIYEQRRYIEDDGTYEQTGQDFLLTIYAGDRSHGFLAKEGASGFISVSRLSPYEKLTWTGGSLSGTGVVYTHMAADGTETRFQPIGSGGCGIRCAYVSQIAKPDGTVLDFGYASWSSGGATFARLKSVTSSRGYALLLEGNGGAVTKACMLNLAETAMPANGLCPASAPSRTLYAYSGGKLTGVTSATNAVWSFTYPAADKMAFVKPGYTAPWLVNTLASEEDEQNVLQDVVVRQDFADGRYFTYAPRYSPTLAVPNYRAGGTATDSQGASVVVQFSFPIVPGTGPNSPCTNPPCPIYKPGDQVYQQTPGPTSIRDEINRKTEYNYCDPVATNGCLVGKLRSFTDPYGIKTEVWYDGYDNLIRTKRHAKFVEGAPTLAPIETSATYDCAGKPKSCAKPTSITDARGNVTRYVYSPDHGGILKETKPAVNPGTAGLPAVEPETRYEYAQRYAWLSNGAGGHVRAATPVWLLVATSTCRTSAATGNPAAPCAVTGDEVRTAYDYGPDGDPNNLLLRGQTVTADGQTLRTCFSYDTLGRRLSETSANANLETCQ